MAKEQFVADLTPGCRVESRFFVMKQQQGTGKSPHKFILRDRTGDIPARSWPGNSQVHWSEIQSARYADITGRVEHNSYSHNLEVTVDAFAPVSEPDCMADFLPTCPRDRKEMWAEFSRLVKSVEQPTLRALLLRLAGDRSFCRAYCTAPAAEYQHHPYCGGLLEHSLEVAQLAEVLARPMDLNRDLMITAALLHDVGKLEEMDCSTPAFARTLPGGFMGHIFLGAERVRSTLREIGRAEEEISQLLCHLLLSHHGKKEWGSPVQPCILEAFALHACDLLSVQKFHLADAASGSSSDALFRWCRGVSSFVYTGGYGEEDLLPPLPDRIKEQPAPWQPSIRLAS